MRNYITTQGDMFDIIAMRVYGSEMHMHLLVDANPAYRKTVVFPANCELVVPDNPGQPDVSFPGWRAPA
jgi:phage tail protein X